MAALKGSDLSLSRVRANFRDGSDLVYSEATKSGFMSRFSKYRIIQLYTHAVASVKMMNRLYILQIRPCLCLNYWEKTSRQLDSSYCLHAKRVQENY